MLNIDYSRLYLTVILGENVNVKFADSDERYKYKKDYERFKTTVTYVLICFLGVSYFFPYRFIDAVCNFLMVWYYCTLTIREAILRINGSRIKGWWLFHHYIATVLCAITLTWRDGNCYREFRPFFLTCSSYIAAVQLLQSYYQTACLRRLYALGQRFEMDITIEGFSSFMFKGLTFLLPFLIIGYMLQAYCAYKLFFMYFNYNCDEEWHVLVVAILFSIISFGNMFTICSVFIRKLQTEDLSHLKTKYQAKSE